MNLKTISIAASIFMVSSLYAQPSIKKFNENQQAVFEFLADDMQYSKTLVIGKGNATVINLDYLITADEANYDTKTGEITLIGNVSAYKGNSLFLKSDSIKIKMQENYSFLEPFYLQDSASGIWVSADEAEFNDTIYRTSDASVSSCSINNPIWSLKASSGEYDTQKEWMSLWNPRLCIYNMPVMYFPYLSFSLGFKRKSGLLYPLFGNSRDDGFLYSQPIFIAPSNFWDMTFAPQVRSKRGAGFYNEFRFIDDKDEILWLNLGYFANKKDYQERYDLENRNHYGLQLKYERKDLLSSEDSYFYEDGMHADISQVSDIDYFRLQNNNAEDKTDLQGNLLTSRFNYFLKSDSDYIGLYARYYSNLEQNSNANTIQTLPEIQYHRQIDNILVDDLYYSFDYKITNYTRREGFSATQQQVYLPFIYTKEVFDDYLNLSISPVVYATAVDYSRSNFDSGRYVNNHYVFKANTDLMKSYDNFGHTINLEAKYIMSGFDYKSGYFDQFFVLPGSDDEVELSIFQSFYDNDNNLKLSHKLKQYYYFIDNGEKIGELESELEYFYDYHWRFLSSIFYNHTEARISEATHQISYTNNDELSLFFGHFVRERFAREDLSQWRFGEANYINAGFYKSFAYFDVFANIGYDYKEDYFKTWSVGINTQVRCFKLGLKYASEVYPTLTTRGVEARDDKYVLLTLELMPLLKNGLKIGS
ncbi:LPS-assembly protein LptD [Helicobacter sp. WB40]|uniref:LPS-assembly protein LptD n=1 Tax=Helicobacter sp. WB40 TaxID=3004130 RepID=UPI0022EBA8DB|nr:LPS assembly protein LptD [Helicobacter sp. WB40]MDA3967640.1 LPS assembly protein LptD [Helicobacter sp. WB40]